jgi:branched-chain amino acid transport system substrate-binding protein
MRQRRSTTIVIAIALSLLAAACGTRLPDSAFEATAEGGSGQPASAGPRRGGPVSGDAATAEGTDTGGTGGTAGGDPAAGAATGGGTGGAAGAAGGTGGGGPGGPNTASDVGVTPTEIRIGNITAVNGVLGDAFAPSLRGLQAFVDYTNAKGGVNGRKLVLVSCDDREDRTRNLQCAQKAVEQDKVFAFIANNSRSEGGSAPYINGKGVPVFMDIPITNAVNRFPHFWSMYPQWYPRDGKAVGYKGKVYLPSGNYRWFKQNVGAKKAAVFFYGEISESSQAGAFIKKGLELEGFQVTSYSINFANPSFDQPVLTMQRDGTDLIYDAMDDGANRKMCDSMQRYNLKVKAKVSTVVAYGQSVGENFSQTCRDSYFIAGDTATYSDTSNPAVKEFRDAFAKYKPGAELHQWSLEGWKAGRAFVDAVKSMGPNVTRKGLEDWLRGLNRYQNGGLSDAGDWQPMQAEYDKGVGEDCFTIAQWSDASKGWTQKAGINNCVPDAHFFQTDAAEQGD